jgi:hypothetical protein
MLSILWIQYFIGGVPPVNLQPWVQRRERDPLRGFTLATPNILLETIGVYQTQKDLRECVWLLVVGRLSRGSLIPSVMGHLSLSAGKQNL